MAIPPAPPSQPASLLRTIATEVIPRLMLAHRDEGTEPERGDTAWVSRGPPTVAEVEAFARVASSADLTAALEFVEQVCREGLTLESVLLELVAPTARLLGAQWEDDRRSFTEVSTGLGTLQQVVHVLGPTFAPTLPHRGLVVLTAAAGEQHTLGLYVLAEFLRRAGWGVQVDASMSAAEIIKLVSVEHVVLLGLSVTNTALLKPLAATIAAVKRSSLNRSLAVLVGGAVDLRDFAERTGATWCGADPRSAVSWLEGQLGSPSRRT